MFKKIRNNIDAIIMLLLIVIGILLISGAFIAMFSIQGHEVAITALLALGVSLILIGALLPKVEGGLEIGPNGLKLKIKQLSEKVKKAEAKVPANSVSNLSSKRGYSTEEITEQILQEAANSPLSAFIHLGETIERRFRILLAATNWLKPSPGMNFVSVIDFVTERKLVAVALSSSLKAFWEVRNSIAHSTGQNSNEDVLRAIDMGITILKMIDGIPHERNIVFHPGVKVYEDKECKTARKDVVGVLLNTLSPGGTMTDRRIFPTRQTYSIGQELSWEWGFENIWRDSWYKDPETGEIKLAWISSAEFMGRPLDNVV